MNMKELRERKQLRLIDVAYNLGVTETSVRNWEHGRSTPKLSFAQTRILMNLYDCSFDQLEQSFVETLKEVGA